MHYALVNNIQTPPSPGLKGTCPSCGAEMLPKCGNQRVHHWAHRGIRPCDAWWEPETLWHRSWKDHYPASWQEVVRQAPSGEKHIADVLTPHGLAIEFQHSRLRPDERAAREAFHETLLWVVDCTRLKRDLPRFTKGSQHMTRTKWNGVYTICFPEDVFPSAWLNCRVPVLFDFGHHKEGPAANMWCLLPQRIEELAIAVALSRDYVVSMTQKREHLVPANAIFRHVAEDIFKSRRAEMSRLLNERPWWLRHHQARRYARF